LNNICRRVVAVACLLAVVSLVEGCQSVSSGVYNVRAFGARGDGLTLDTPAINSAIAAASGAGGGMVLLPTGNYLCYSIHLQNYVTIYLDQGATIVAAGTASKGDYDPPEPNEFDHYQDFGHTHWHNSLIWGEEVHDVAIEGPGVIYGKGLSRGGNTAPTTQQTAGRGRGGRGGFGRGFGGRGFGRGRGGRGFPTTTPTDYLPTPYSSDDRADAAPTYLFGTTRPVNDLGYPNAFDSLAPGIGNKAIALKNCHNILLRDISILQGGHFGILATGADNLTIDNVKIDTNRDGMDIDACKHVRISNCSVNSPYDDGICLKSSYALGEARPCQDVNITNCYVTGGYVVGSFLDGTYRKHLTDWFVGLGGAPRPATRPATQPVMPTTGPSEFGFSYGFPTTRPTRFLSVPGRTGRIKFGTESNGGFINIAISNCVFEDCQGLALETVDGGPIEDVTIDNIAMRDIVSVPIFIRLGNRARGPFAPPGIVRGIIISNVVCENVASRYACIIAGIPGHPIEDVQISNVRITYPGDQTRRDLTTRPSEMEKDYPEPTMFHAMPAYGFFIRHVKDIELDHIDLKTAGDDIRPAFWLEDVEGADFEHVKAPHAASVPEFRFIKVKDFSIHQSPGMDDAWNQDADEPVPAGTPQVNMDQVDQPTQ
jgi:polygalacturonase